MCIYIDINECLSDNGECEHDCTNTEGNFSCSCNTGYELDSNGFNCSGNIIHVLNIIPYPIII